MMRIDPYEVLGVDKCADSVTVKRAYRKAARKAHPDRHGGDTQAMVRVNVAYDILSNPRRRERFDLGAEDQPTVPPLDLLARNKLAQVFLQFAAQPARVNIPASARSALQEMKRQARVKLADMAQTQERLKGRLVDVAFQGEGPNVFADTLTSSIANLTHETEKAETDVKAIDRALELLPAYTSGVIERPQFSSPFMAFTGS